MRIAHKSALAAVSALALTGCGAPTPTTGTGQAPSARTVQSAVPATTATAAAAAEEPAPSDPCGSWSGTDIVKALSSKKHKPATAVPEEESYFTCSWGLPQTLREELGMSGEGSGGDVAIEIEPYGAQTYGTGTIEWDVPTADDLVPNFLAAHEGSKALPGSPPAAFDGISGVAVATAGDTWTRLTLFQCPADECGDAAIKAARTLIQD